MNAITQQTKRTALHVAASHAHLHLCNLLITYGAVPLAADSSGRTPAHVVIESRSPSQQAPVLQCLASLLAATGPGVEDVLKQQWLSSLLRCATQHRSTACVRLLLEYGAADVPHGDTKRCCVHIAASNRELGILDALLDAYAENADLKVHTNNNKRRCLPPPNCKLTCCIEYTIKYTLQSASCQMDQLCYSSSKQDSAHLMVS